MKMAFTLHFGKNPEGTREPGLPLVSTCQKHIANFFTVHGGGNISY